MKKTSGGSGGFEVEFDADRFFDLLNRSPEVTREILERLACLEALRDLHGRNTRPADHRTTESHAGINSRELTRLRALRLDGACERDGHWPEQADSWSLRW